MEQKIFLDGSESKFSNNVERAITMALSNKTRMLPNEDALDNFSLYEQYNRERDECRNYRIILNINPICSNILFNARTEIVVNEGSDNCDLLIGNKTFNKEEYAKNAVNGKSKIDYLHAIRNTEYSHKENGCFIYHCGYDIFNNHMLRKTDFIHVNKLPNNASLGESEKYNTIFDLLRDANGDVISEDLNVNHKSSKTKSNLHLYQYDTIMSMAGAFADNCIEKDGWWGFTNPNTIEIPNSNNTEISINRMMANNKSCEFIDLYPDRSLFSFVPKFNKHRYRIEKNWDYCLTYPYKSDYDMINTICGGENGAIRVKTKLTYNGAGQEMLECSSYFKHNLKKGDDITLFYYEPKYKTLIDDTDLDDLTLVRIDDIDYLYRTEDIDEDGNIKFGDEILPRKVILSKKLIELNRKITISSTGDANGDCENRIFNIKFEDIGYIYNYIRFFDFFYKKNSGGLDCQYYARKFKKIKDNDELRSDINKTGFGTNIYGDDVAQVLFLDNINIDGLLDNNNRPLTELFFTVIKRNAGYKEWYINNNYGHKDVEISHCFGKVTSSIDFSGIENEPFDYNVHYSHNVELPKQETTIPMINTLSAWGDTLLIGKSNVLEDDITIDGYDEFYGDIVEYDINKATETVIGNVLHRFNTAQRELFNRDYRDIKHDVVVSDDYDYDKDGKGKVFSCSTYYVNNIKSPLDENPKNEDLIYGNIYPEGYIYNPHVRIPIRDIDVFETRSSAKPLNYKTLSLSKKGTYLVFKTDGSIETYKSLTEAECNRVNDEIVAVQDEYYEIKLSLPLSFKLYKGDNIAFYDKITSNIAWGEIVNISGASITLHVSQDEFNMVDVVNNDMFNPKSGNRRFYAFWSPDGVPIYAKLCYNKREFVWRKLIKPSEATKGNETYNTPFTNGCFYVEKNVNFFLKRQDPIGKYGLSVPLHIKYNGVGNPLTKFVLSGHKPLDFSDVMYIANNLNNECY